VLTDAGAHALWRAAAGAELEVGGRWGWPRLGSLAASPALAAGARRSGHRGGQRREGSGEGDGEQETAALHPVAKDAKRSSGGTPWTDERLKQDARRVDHVFKARPRC